MTFEPKCKGTSCSGCRYSLDDKIDYNNTKCTGKGDIYSCAGNPCPLIQIFHSDKEKEEACTQCNWISKEKTIHKFFTKEDMRNGMIVDTRGAGKFLYVKSDFYTGLFEYLISFEDYSITELNCYEEDLRFKRHLINETAPHMDITNVYVINNLAFFSAPLKIESEKFLDKIWERYDDFDKALDMIAEYFEVKKESIDLLVDGCEL